MKDENRYTCDNKFEDGSPCKAYAVLKGDEEIGSYPLWSDYWWTEEPETGKYFCGSCSHVLRNAKK